MTAEAVRPAAHAHPAALAAELEADARRSLLDAAMHAALTQHPDAERAADLVLEQEQLLDRITTAGLIPFTAADPASARRSWLDAAIDRIDRSANPLLARYGDLHDRRFEFLAPTH